MLLSERLTICSAVSVDASAITLGKMRIEAPWSVVTCAPAHLVVARMTARRRAREETIRGTRTSPS
jgi:hypothetical protein